MAFDMNQIKRKSMTRQNNIKDCLRYIRSNQKLTENVKYAIWKYTEYRFNKRNHSNFTAKRLSEMIDELLEYVIPKQIKDITYIDVINNENKILYEIKRAIYYGATHYLYYQNNDGTMDIDTSKLVGIKAEPLRLKDEEKLTKEQVVNYYKDLMI